MLVIVWYFLIANANALRKSEKFIFNCKTINLKSLTFLYLTNDNKKNTILKEKINDSFSHYKEKL